MILRNVFWYRTKEMREIIVEKYSYALEYIPDRYKTKKIYKIRITLEICVEKLLKSGNLHWNLFLNGI